MCEGVTASAPHLADQSSGITCEQTVNTQVNKTQFTFHNNLLKTLLKL